MTSADTHLYCLIGDPVAHSLSPFIMNLAFDECGVDARYVALRVRERHLGGMIDGLKALDVAGANVTYPLKERVLACVDTATPAVEVIGAANCLKLSEEGIEAHNTDAWGAVYALEAIAGVPVRGRRILVLGAGGSARAAAWGLLEHGAGRVTLAARDRSIERGGMQALRDRVGSERIDVTRMQFIDEVAGRSDIVINATPVGMSGQETDELLTDAAFRSELCCFDFVYHPRDTAFLQRARRHGATTVDGLAQLVAQAFASFRYWTGREFSVRDMYAAASGRVTDHGDDNPEHSHNGDST